MNNGNIHGNGNNGTRTNPQRPNTNGAYNANPNRNVANPRTGNNQANNFQRQNARVNNPQGNQRVNNQRVSNPGVNNPRMNNAQRNGNSQTRQSGTRPMSEEEIARRREFAARKRREREEEIKRKNKNREMRRLNFQHFLDAVIVGVGGLLAIALIIGVIVLVIFLVSPDRETYHGTVKYYWEGEEIRREKAKNCYLDGVIYVCFNDISEKLGMAESGSSEGLKFILLTDEESSDSSGTGNEESVRFMTDTRYVEINGEIILLDIPNVIRDEEVWVAADFLTEYMTGIAFEENPGKSIVNISRIVLPAELDENGEEVETEASEKQFEPIAFMLKEAKTVENIEEDPLVGEVEYSDEDTETEYSLNFLTDLSAYEQYMNPEGELRDAFLVLVNKENKLSASDVPDDLVDVVNTSPYKDTQKLREYAEYALEAMYKEMHANEFWDMAVYSGYRTYEYQNTLFETYVGNEMAADSSLSREDAEAIVLTYSSRPGTSEHQTGLAVDMDTSGSFTNDFAYTEEYAWLEENAWKFGFILRFPEGKENITSIQFESWHYRYVGRYHAQKIHESGLCLEEYLEAIN